MAIRSVTCQCGRVFGVEELHPGRIATCPACGVSIQVPHPPIATEPDDLTGGGFEPHAQSSE